MQYSLYDGITYGIECMDKDGISEEEPGKDVGISLMLAKEL